MSTLRLLLGLQKKENCYQGKNFVIVTVLIIVLRIIITAEAINIITRTKMITQVITVIMPLPNTLK
jgi:hypothetical protein